MGSTGHGAQGPSLPLLSLLSLQSSLGEHEPAPQGLPAMDGGFRPSVGTCKAESGVWVVPLPRFPCSWERVQPRARADKGLRLLFLF